MKPKQSFIRCEVNRRKFIVKGTELRGPAELNPVMAYRMYNIAKTTVFEMRMSMRMVWDNAQGSFEYEADATASYPSNITFRLEEVINLAKEFFKRMGSKFFAHPDYPKLNLPPGFWMEMSGTDYNTIVAVYDRFMATRK